MADVDRVRNHVGLRCFDHEAFFSRGSLRCPWPQLAPHDGVGPCFPLSCLLLRLHVSGISPLWYMSKGSPRKAYQAMCACYIKIQAARDVYYMHTLLDAESGMQLGQNRGRELIADTNRAMLASEMVMFLPAGKETPVATPKFICPRAPTCSSCAV